MAEKAEKFATIDQLLAKPARTKTVTMQLGDGEVSVKIKALGSKVYDDLLAAHGPTKAQKAEGASFNPDTFGPALIAASLVEPVVTPEQALAMWTSEDWSRGELSDLFYSAVEINNKGLDIPFSETA